jgi:hypothetical protein
MDLEGERDNLQSKLNQKDDRINEIKAQLEVARG